jgi:hypothetical protein
MEPPGEPGFLFHWLLCVTGGSEDLDDCPCTSWHSFCSRVCRHDAESWATDGDQRYWCPHRTFAGWSYRLLSPCIAGEHKPMPPTCGDYLPYLQRRQVCSSKEAVLLRHANCFTGKFLFPKSFVEFAWHCPLTSPLHKYSICFVCGEINLYFDMVVITVFAVFLLPVFPHSASRCMDLSLC